MDDERTDDLGWLNYRAEAMVHDTYFAGTADEHSSVEQSAYVGPDEEAIQDAWRRLTDKQRFVLGRLRGVNGDGYRYTHREIGEVLGVSHVAVVRIEQRALARLASMLTLVEYELLAA